MTWPEPCEAMFEYLADNDPAELVRMLSDSALKPFQLTFAAEHAGRCPGAREPLLALLDHPSAVVREGAIYGLGRQAPTMDVLARLWILSRTDPSKAIRSVAKDALE